MLKTAVILADAPHHFSVGKPLQKLAGLTLIERQILTLAKIGFTSVVVVTGFEGEALQKYLQSTTWPITLTCLENQDWQNQIQGEFTLLQASTLYDKHLNALLKIDTPKSLQEAEEKILQSCRKSSDGFISRHVNRRISLFCTRYLMNTFVSANVMTLITSIIGFASGYFAWLATPVDFAIAGFLFNAASILDGVDGELARIRLSDSKLGQWLDTLSDNGALLAFMLGTMLGLKHRPDLGVSPVLIPSAILGLLLLLVVMAYFLVRYTNSGSLVAIKEKLEAVGKINPVVNFFISLNFLIRRDFFATVVMFVAFLDKPHWVIWGLSVSTHVAWIFLVGFLLFFRSHLKK